MPGRRLPVRTSRAGRLTGAREHTPESTEELYRELVHRAESC